jgi:hydroxymethylpyrimidine kinase/phosphomethylpyrimidine kinase
LTPNIPEAETLAGITIDSEADMRRAAAIIRKMGTTAVLIKGGHLKRQKADSESTSETPGHEEEAVDLLDNGGTVTVFREKLIPGAQLHGSGCILSAAIAAGLGNGSSLEDAVAAAKSFVLIAIRSSIRLG